MDKAQKRLEVIKEMRGGGVQDIAKVSRAIQGVSEILQLSQDEQKIANELARELSSTTANMITPYVAAGLIGTDRAMLVLSAAMTIGASTLLIVNSTIEQRVQDK